MSARKSLKMNGNLIFLVVTEVVFALLAWRTFSYSFVATLMPGIIIACILIVTTILLVAELRRSLKQENEEKPAEASPALGSDRAGERKRELEILAWLVALVVMIYLLGFLVAVPIFLFLFLRIRFSLRWVTTISITAGLEAGMYLIFVVWLQTMLYPGLLSNLFIPQ
jgi:hypothetical protein